MKKVAALLGLCLLLTACPKTVSVTVKFNYDFSGFATCSSTVTRSCVSGFTWGYLSGTSRTALHTTTAAVCSGQPAACTDSISVQMPSTQPTVFYVVANGVDSAGLTWQSAPGLTGQSKAANVPTGVTLSYR